MDLYDFYKKKHKTPISSGNIKYTVGEKLKENSDRLMEETWDNDIQSKVCYIYDHFHDNQKEIEYGMTYENTTKLKIDAKFIITQYQSLAKDRVEYHIMFKPSQKRRFVEGDDLYYYETDFAKRYRADFPVGLYIDIPDDTGEYHRWLICEKEISNQFVKCIVLPCNYRLMWIENQNGERIKRKMWGCIRSQNSYNSGLWTNYITTSQENQEKIWLPMNSISERIWYVNNSSTNMRVIVSVLTENPIVWQVSKVESTAPFGLQKITLSQDAFNQYTDYVNFETKEMFADYFEKKIEPEDGDNKPDTENITAKITTSSNTIKVGGSYKLFTLNIYDKDGNDITSSYSPISKDNWSLFVDDEDVKESGLAVLLEQDEDNKMKIKLLEDRSYLTKILNVTCVVDDIKATLQLQITI